MYYYSNEATAVEHKRGSHLEALRKSLKSVFGYTLSISVHSLSVCIHLFWPKLHCETQFSTFQLAGALKR